MLADVVKHLRRALDADESSDKVAVFNDLTERAQVFERQVESR